MRKLTMIAGLGILLISLHTEAAGMDYSSEPAAPMSKDQGTDMAQAAVMISAPADAAILPANQPVKITFNAIPGPKGDHVHLYVDGKRTAVLH